MQTPVPPAAGCSLPQHAFTWGTDWNTTAGGAAARDPATPQPPASASVGARAQWVLGPPPPEGYSFGSSFGEETNPSFTYTALMMHQARGDPALPSGTGNSSVTRMPVSVGAYRQANLYYPTSAIAAAAPSLPVVVLLHPFSYHTGYVSSYVKQQPGTSSTDYPFYELAKRGYLVLAMELSGFGTRVTESPRAFYARHPKASRLGAMVADVRAALELLHCLGADTRPGSGGGADPRCVSGEDPGGAYPDHLPSVPSVDTARVHVLGYSLGGAVALHAAALLDGGAATESATGAARIASVASFSGFTPMRSDTDASSTGGVRRWWETHALAPRLGLFQGRETDIPYDYDELLGAIAPRPTLVWAPRRDRSNTIADVEAAVHAANASHPGPAWSGLQLLTPDTDSRFGNVELLAYVAFLAGLE